MPFRLPQGRRSRIALAVAGALALILSVSIVLYLRSVDRERERLAGLDRVIVDVEPLKAPDARGVSLWLSGGAPSDVEPFGGRIYAASTAGLEVYDADGRFLKRYTTLDGLPENALTCLEKFGEKLYIGTLQSGLVAFDGESFTRYTFVRPAASHISALKAVGGDLLVGTFESGVFEFNGADFSRRYQATLGDDCVRVTSILDSGSRVYIGTHNAGLFEWKEGSVNRFQEASGLASDRVTGLALRDGAVLVATDMGVAELKSDGHAAQIATTPNATGVAVRNGEVFVASITKGVAPITALSDPTHATSQPVSDRPGDPAMVSSLPTRFVQSIKFEENVLWALTDRGLFVCPTLDGPVRFVRFSDPDRDERLLSNGHVAALGIDGRGRLWAGLFDGGIDILDPQTGELTDRIDDPDLHEINALAVEPVRDRVWVATSKGLAVFDAGRKTRILGEREGLVGENIAAVALDDTQPGDRSIATNRGVSIMQRSIARSLTAFHGLPNNHTYAVATLNGKTFVGTLGGLAEIDHLHVGRVFTTADSKLPHNWVNALVPVGGTLFIGTYGGGVAMLTPAGELVPFEDTKGLEVNPGAMYADGRRLYVGTLSAGLFVYDLDTGSWSRVSRVLSSTNVTAIAADATYLYIGTEFGITRIERRALS